jgi:hypothetical protein
MRRYLLRFPLLALLFGAAAPGYAGPIFIENRVASPTRPATISLAPLASKPAAQRKIVLTLSNSRPERQTIEFEVDGPAGTTLSFYSAMATPRTSLDLNPKRKKVSPGLMYRIADSGSKKITLGASNSGGGSGGGGNNNYVCGCLSAADIQEIIASFRQVGINYTTEQVCSQFASIPTPGCNLDTPYLTNGSPFGNTAAISAFIQRDACIDGGKRPGKAVIEFNLSKVPANLLTGGKITVKPTFSAYSGNRQVKLKKAGDAKGKFAGIPLLLASPAGAVSFSGSTGAVYLTKYSNNALVSSKQVKVADNVFYRNMVLWRTPLSGVLTGGQGTFEIRGNQAGYSICAKLVRKDQFFNGYPRNSE